MSQPSTADNTLTSEEHDQEVEEYIWNLMGRAGLLSELKSQIAQFIQNNGKTKEKFPVDASRVQPAILSMIYEYLKWVGMKNTCALLMCESPVKFETSFDFDSTNGAESVPELCTYYAEKTTRTERSLLNGHGENKSVGSSLLTPKTPMMMTNGPNLAQAASSINNSSNNNNSLNHTFLISGPADTSSQTNQLSNNNKTAAPPATSSPPSSFIAQLTASSNAPRNATSNTTNNNSNNVNNSSTTVIPPPPPPSKIPTASGTLVTTTPTNTQLGTSSAQSSSCASESNSESEATPPSSGNNRGDSKGKVYTAQYEKHVSESSAAKKSSSNNGNHKQSQDKELKPSSSDQSLQHKSREQLQFGFMTEKQKMEAFNKKFSGSELFSKKKSSPDENPFADPFCQFSSSNNAGGGGETKGNLESSLKNNNNNHNNNNNSGSFEPDLDDESISDLHDSTADDVTQDLSIDSDSKVMAANAAECDHVLKLK